jgi:hypothetical protein
MSKEDTPAGNLLNIQSRDTAISEQEFDQKLGIGKNSGTDADIDNAVDSMPDAGANPASADSDDIPSWRSPIARLRYNRAHKTPEAPKDPDEKSRASATIDAIVSRSKKLGADTRSNARDLKEKYRKSKKEHPVFYRALYGTGAILGVLAVAGGITYYAGKYADKNREEVATTITSVASTDSSTSDPYMPGNMTGTATTTTVAGQAVYTNTAVTETMSTATASTMAGETTATAAETTGTTASVDTTGSAATTNPDPGATDTAGADVTTTASQTAVAASATDTAVTDTGGADPQPDPAPGARPGPSLSAKKEYSRYFKTRLPYMSSPILVISEEGKDDAVVPMSSIQHGLPKKDPVYTLQNTFDGRKLRIRGVAATEFDGEEGSHDIYRISFNDKKKLALVMPAEENGRKITYSLSPTFNKPEVRSALNNAGTLSLENLAAVKQYADNGELLLVYDFAARDAGGKIVQSEKLPLLVTFDGTATPAPAYEASQARPKPTPQIKEPKAPPQVSAPKPLPRAPQQPKKKLDDELTYTQPAPEDRPITVFGAQTNYNGDSNGGAITILSDTSGIKVYKDGVLVQPGQAAPVLGTYTIEQQQRDVQILSGARTDTLTQEQAGALGRLVNNYGATVSTTRPATNDAASTTIPETAPVPEISSNTASAKPNWLHPFRRMQYNREHRRAQEHKLQADHAAGKDENVQPPVPQATMQQDYKDFEQKLLEAKVSGLAADLAKFYANDLTQCAEARAGTGQYANMQARIAKQNACDSTLGNLAQRYAEVNKPGVQLPDSLKILANPQGVYQPQTTMTLEQ